MKQKHIGVNDYDEYWKERLDTKRTGKTGVHYRVIDLVLKYVKKGTTVLDIGVGPAHIYRGVMKDYDAYGAEISKNAYDTYEFQKEKIFLGNAIENIPTFSEVSSYDGIIVSMLLHHMEEPNVFLKKVHDKLNEDGHLIVSTPNIGFWRNRLEFFIHGSFPTRLSKAHKIFLNIPQWTKMIESEGFKIVEVCTMNRKFPFLDHFMPQLIGGKVFIVAKKI